MLKKQSRLPSFCFKRVYQGGEIRRGRFVTLKLIQNKKDISRFGFVVSAKVIKKATKRNLLKRRTNQLISSLMAQIKPGLDFVFIIKKEAGFADLKEDFKRLLNV